MSKAYMIIAFIVHLVCKFAKINENEKKSQWKSKQKFDR